MRGRALLPLPLVGLLAAGCGGNDRGDDTTERPARAPQESIRGCRVVEAPRPKRDVGEERPRAELDPGTEMPTQAVVVERATVEVS